MAVEEQKDKAPAMEGPMKLTIKEFKMWLRGVEEMQEGEWAPTPTQWAKIRQKIFQIEDNVFSAPAYTGIRSPAAGGVELPPGAERVFQPLNTAPPAGGNTVPVPSSLNVAAPAQPATRMRATPSGMPVSLATGNANTPVKTADVDTSHGKPYSPPFV